MENIMNRNRNCVRTNQRFNVCALLFENRNEKLEYKPTKFRINSKTQPNVLHVWPLCISNGILFQSFKCAARSYCAFGIFSLSFSLLLSIGACCSRGCYCCWCCLLLLLLLLLTSIESAQFVTCRWAQIVCSVFCIVYCWILFTYMYSSLRDLYMLYFFFIIIFFSRVRDCVCVYVFLASHTIAFRAVCDRLYIGFIKKAIRIYTQLCSKTFRNYFFSFAQSLFIQHAHAHISFVIFLK